jgi:hypothetical protein
MVRRPREPAGLAFKVGKDAVASLALKIAELPPEKAS